MINRRRAEGIRSAQQNILALRAKYLRQLADRGRLASAIHANNENHFRRAVYSLDGPGIRGIQNGQQFFFKEPFQFLYILDLFTVGFVAELAQDFLGGRGSQVGADQRGLEIVKCVPVDFLAKRDDFFNTLGEVLPRASDGLLHALEETSFLFFRAAEQSLNHEKSRNLIIAVRAGRAPGCR